MARWLLFFSKEFYQQVLNADLSNWLASYSPQCCPTSTNPNRRCSGGDVCSKCIRLSEDSVVVDDSEQMNTVTHMSNFPSGQLKQTSACNCNEDGSFCDWVCVFIVPGFCTSFNQEIYFYKSSCLIASSLSLISNPLAILGIVVAVCWCCTRNHNQRLCLIFIE